MNIYTANNLDFRDLLSKLGHEPVRVGSGGKDIWYFSPFRKEEDPSFHIREGREYDWVWFDFGHEGASTILDFIMQYKRTDKKGALGFLDTLYPFGRSRAGSRDTPDPKQIHFLFPPQSPPQAENFQNSPQLSQEFELVDDRPLHSELILTYLESRQVPRRIASKYFRLVRYRKSDNPTQRPYFGFGMQNISGGWEVRSASDRPKELFKTALLVKDFTLVKGSEPGRGAVNVFEGQTDFVSLLTLIGADALKGDALILNGLKLYGRAADYIRSEGYTQIHTFLDNNVSGQETTGFFIRDFGTLVSNQSPKFLPHVDLNDALKTGFKTSFLPSPGQTP